MIENVDDEYILDAENIDSKYIIGTENVDAKILHGFGRLMGWILC